MKSFFFLKKNKPYFSNKNILLILFLFKLFAIFFTFFSSFSHPHIIRQTDTMSVSLRYWLRWYVEKPIDRSLFPAVLTSGGLRGIQSMEFPLYNLIFFPIFSFDIYWSRILVLFLNLILMILLTFWAFKLWRSQFSDQDFIKRSFYLLFLTSISSLYFYRFMPDYFSFILTLIGMGYFFNNKKLQFTFFVSLGLLVKPTSIITLVIFLYVYSLKEVWNKKILLWMLPSIIITILYYTAGMSYLRSLSDQEVYFYTSFRNPLIQFLDFISHPKEIFLLIFDSIFNIWYMPFLIFAVLKYKKGGLLFLILIIQILMISILDGHHSFVHDYYYISVSLTVTLLISSLYNILWFRRFFLMIIIIVSLERLFYEIRPLWNENELWSSCIKLRERNPNFPWRQGYPFNSEKTHIPYLGLCFGERQGSSRAEYGFYFNPPIECKVIDSEKGINLVKCQNLD
jgi:hypothetical protein